jgi:hypothetical protein
MGENFIRSSQVNEAPAGQKNQKPESTTTRTAGCLDFAAKGGKRQAHAVP